MILYEVIYVISHYVTADNGGEATDGGYNTPLRGQKKGLWEGGIRSVAFVNSPLLADREQGAVLRDLMHITDWFPTLVGVAGGNVDDLPLDGFDMWPAIRYL